MKRIVALLMVLAVLALGCVPALAAKEILTITGDDTCAPGSTITLAFGLTEGSNAAAVNVEVSYDTDTFEFVEYQNGDIIENAMAAGNGTKGKVLFSLATLTPITKAGSLFTATFKVDSNAQGSHDFYFYSTAFSAYTSADGESEVDVETNTAKKVLTVEGEIASQVSVTPVYSTDDTGAQSVVSAQNGENATGLLVNPSASSKQEENQNPQGDGNGSSTWVVVGVVVLALGALGLLVVAAVAKAKKGDKELEQNESILTDDAKALLDLEPDALEEKENKE